MNIPVLLLYTIQALIHVAFCVFLVFRCFDNKYRYSRKTTILLAVIFVILSVLLIEIFLESPSPLQGYALPVAFLWMVLASVFALVAIRANVFLLLFVVSFLMSSMLKTTCAARTIAALSFFPKGEVPYILLTLGLLFLTVPFVWFLINHLYKKVVNLPVGTSPFQWLFVLPLAFFLMDLLTAESTYISKGYLGLAILLLSSLCAYFSYVAMLQMFLKMHESLLANTQMQLAEQMVNIQKEQYQHLVEGMERNARTEHDFRHHLIVIKSLADSTNLQGLQQYLAEYEQEYLPESTAPLCNLHLADVLLRHYMARAQAAGIEMEATAFFPEGFSLPEHDLCVLFGNLLENALESCLRQTEGRKFIELKTQHISQYMLYLKVRNSYSGEIVPKGDLLLSSKRSGTGVGLSTIRHIAQQNGGSCVLSYENGVFTARILLIS